MRLLLKHGYTTGCSYGRNGYTQPYIELWQQPFHRWLAATIYHWYDMRVYRLPGFSWLERRLQNRHERRHPGDWTYLPLSCQQDMRCDHLSRLQRTTLATVNIDQETFDRLTPDWPKAQDPT
jgi:hypothetical protein